MDSSFFSQNSKDAVLSLNSPSIYGSAVNLFQRSSNKFWPLYDAEISSSRYPLIKYLLRFFVCLAHPNLSATLATYQSLAVPLT